MNTESRAQQRRSQHDRYRLAKRAFERGSGRTSSEHTNLKRKVWYVACPCEYNKPSPKEGLQGTKVNAEMAVRIESQLRRKIK